MTQTMAIEEKNRWELLSHGNMVKVFAKQTQL